MLKEIRTIRQAAQEWGNGFNAFPLSMLEKLAEIDIDSWHEVTMPRCGDYVYIHAFPDKDINGNDIEDMEHCGEINEMTEDDTYIIRMENGILIELEEDDFDVEPDSFFPMWGTMWQFGESIDEWWIEDHLQEMSNCGFRIYEHDEYGYFFGIDGAGYDFYESHWIPLYKARGLQWHEEEVKETA